jgi:hypothetical protein
MKIGHFPTRSMSGQYRQRHSQYWPGLGDSLERMPRIHKNIELFQGQVFVVDFDNDGAGRIGKLITSLGQLALDSPLQHNRGVDGCQPTNLCPVTLTSRLFLSEDQGYLPRKSAKKQKNGGRSGVPRMFR